MARRSPRSPLPRLLLWVAFLLVPLVGAAVVGPRLLKKYGASWVRTHLKLDPTAPAAAPVKDDARAEAAGTAGDARAAAAAAARLARLEREQLDHSTVIAPDPGEKDAAGERVRWFQGFGLSVESRPSGARVLVNGGDVGETPIVTSIDCAPGDPVKVEVRRRGLGPRRLVTTCRENQLVELTVKLE